MPVAFYERSHRYTKTPSMAWFSSPIPPPLIHACRAIDSHAYVCSTLSRSLPCGIWRRAMRCVLVVLLSVCVLLGSSSERQASPVMEWEMSLEKDIRGLAILYRCYRLAGRFDEAEAISQRFVSRMSSEMSKLSWYEAATVYYTFNSPLPPYTLGANSVLTAQRDKETCETVFGIYQLTQARPAYIFSSGPPYRKGNGPLLFSYPSSQ